MKKGSTAQMEHNQFIDGANDANTREQSSSDRKSSIDFEKFQYIYLTTLKQMLAIMTCARNPNRKSATGNCGKIDQFAT